MTKKKNPADLKKVGRPSLYKQEYCDIVIELGRLGKSKAQIASDPRIDVARNTLDEWCRENPEFLNALTRARDLAIAHWEGLAEMGIQSVGFNSGLWGRIMSARFPEDYRESKEIVGAGGKDLIPRTSVLNIPPTATPEQLEALARGFGLLGDSEYDA